MPQTDRRYRDIVAHYEDCLARYGVNRLGVDWPRREDAELRYAVMLDLIHPNGNGFGRAGCGYAVAEGSGGSQARAVA
jgi:hypothetical protein